MSEDFFTKLDELIKPKIMLRIVGSPGTNCEFCVALSPIVDVIHRGEHREFVL